MERPGASQMRCERFGCTLVERDCIARQEARTKHGKKVGEDGVSRRIEARPIQFLLCDPGLCAQGRAVRERLEATGEMAAVLRDIKEARAWSVSRRYSALRTMNRRKRKETPMPEKTAQTETRLAEVAPADGLCIGGCGRKPRPHGTPKCFQCRLRDGEAEAGPRKARATSAPAAAALPPVEGLPLDYLVACVNEAKRRTAVLGKALNS